MKKLISLVCVAALCLGVAACSNGTTPNNTATPDASSTVSVSPEASASAAQGSKLAEIKAAGKLVMVTSPDFSPYEFEDPRKSGQDKYVGLDIELGKYIAQELGVELEITPMDFDATLAAIASKQCDIGISGYSPSEDRKATMDFTDVYYEAGQVIVVRAEDAEKYTTVESLKGLKVGAQNGSEQQKIVEGQLPDSTLQQYTKVPEAILALQSKQVEAVAMEEPNAENNVATNDKIAISKIAVTGSVTGTAVAVPKGSEDLVAEINKIIKKAKDEGKIDEWMELARTTTKEIVGK